MFHDFNVDGELTNEQKVIVSKLTTIELKEIDDALLNNASNKWRKVATTMFQFENKYQTIPDLFFSKRIKILVEESKLESQGNLDKMRYSEVRILNE